MSVRSGGSSVQGAELSPAESVVIYGDRLFDTRGRAGPSTVRLPLSGRHMSLDKLVFAGLIGALGSLAAAGEVEVTLKPRKGLIRTKDQVHVRRLSGAGKWPRLSPEARLGSWLAQRPDREAWLEELVTTEIIPEIATHPHRVALRYLVEGLMARGIVEEVERRVFLVFRLTEYQVLSSATAGLQDVKERVVDASLRCHEQLSAELREKCREAWRGAIKVRLDTP